MSKSSPKNGLGMPALVVIVASCVAVLVLAPQQASGKLRLAPIFRDHMVLQRGKPIPVWGWAAAGEKITVRFDGRSKGTRANAKGVWKLKLAASKASKKPKKLVVQGKKSRLTVRQVRVGEVWLCSGQSNMEWGLKFTESWRTRKKRRVKKKKLPPIRLLHIQRRSLSKATRDLRLTQGFEWIPHTALAAQWFSGVCYYFGEYLGRKLQVPIGLIQAAWGGTRIEAWMPRSLLASFPSGKRTLEQQKLRDRAYAYSLRRSWHRNSPAALYNSMIHPLLPYAIKGVLWYQGESNLSNAKEYGQYFPAMIQRWRWLWGESFPFLYVQIAPYRYRHHPASRYNRLCEAQSQTLQKTHHTAMVTISDITNLRDIHPRKKREVGRRLYLAALAKAYGKSVVYTGPLYRSMRRQKNKLLLSFRHVGGGLVARGGRLKHFRIAGKDKKFYPAQAYIVGDTVAVWSAKVPRPVAVRYAWRDTAIPNLFNMQGFPASTFRTDRW